MARQLEVAVIGAGIVGLSSAIAIQRRHKDCKVTLISEKLTPETTSDGAAGLWWPYLLGDTPVSDIYDYASKTFDYLTSLWRTPSGGKMGVSLIPCVVVTDSVGELPPWKDIVFGFQELTEPQLKQYGQPHYKQGFRFVTYTCEGWRLMPHLLQEFYSNGGTFIKKKISKLEEVGTVYDVIVNCTGLGAKELVGDKEMHPIRGQIHRVRAPWQKSILIDESDVGNYVIPNQEFVVLGGTHQKDDWNTSPDAQDAKFITDGCVSIFPSLEKATLISQWVGLRPGRCSLRLEKETIHVQDKSVTLIHNYGHGGSGLTLFWGCAQRVADVLDSRPLTSKL